MLNTYELIASTTVGSGGTSSINFNPIPSTYTDLKLICSIRTTQSSTNGSVRIGLNGTDNSTN